MHRRRPLRALLVATSQACASAVGVLPFGAWWLGIWLALFPAAASATEFCVTCDGPAAHYNCVLPGGTAAPSDSRLKLWCMTELAKAGKHASCSVDRQQKTPCNGEVKSVALPQGFDLGPTPSSTDATAASPTTTGPVGPAQPQPPAAPAQNSQGAAGTIPAQTIISKTQSPAPPSGGPAQAATGAASKAQPTDDGAAPETTDANGSTLKKAGKAVGDAAQKTWTCLTSLFGDC